MFNKISSKQLYYSIIIFVFILGLILRFSSLDVRPIHHDEGLAASFAYYQFIHPRMSTYHYNPLLHGPLLFHLYPLFYELFGVTNWAIRFPMALFNTLILLSFFFLRRFFSRTTFLILFSYLCLSPSIIYWSRFLRHDPIVLLNLALLFLTYFNFTGKSRIFWFPIFFTLQFCIKENAYIHSILFLIYMLFDYFFWEKHQSLFFHFKELIKSHWKVILGGVVASALIYIYLYSAVFSYWPGVLDGLYRKSLSYWINQHHVERIKGPFSYQFFYLAWYEFPFIVSFFIHFIHFYFIRHKRLTFIGIMIFFIPLLLSIFFGKEILNSGHIVEFFKLKIPMDIWCALFIFFNGLTLTLTHMVQKNRSLSFWGFTFTAYFFTYSYVGEKVPWLSIYVLIPGLIYLALYFQGVCFSKLLIVFPNIFRNVSYQKIRIGLALFSFSFLFRIALITNFSQSGSSTEFTSQVHTSFTFHKLMLELQNKLDSKITGKNSSLLVQQDPIWPANWYLINSSHYSHQLRSNEKITDFDYLLQKSPFSHEIKQTYNVTKIPLRYWWVPDWKKLSFKNFIYYVLGHHPWNDPGESYIYYAVRKEANAKDHSVR